MKDIVPSPTYLQRPLCAPAILAYISHAHRRHGYFNFHSPRFSAHTKKKYTFTWQTSGWEWVFMNRLGIQTPSPCKNGQRKGSKCNQTDQHWCAESISVRSGDSVNASYCVSGVWRFKLCFIITKLSLFIMGISMRSICNFLIVSDKHSIYKLIKTIVSENYDSREKWTKEQRKIR